ncbi:MAG: hypothetical protein A3E83_08550 [Gammaproteobacteria bacterium RIFCSPHIGHO2_12_FULL_41_20]|nr:MAG: hypothetical protein A3E83_08550 [Gammaproteobacteria bacterium RIFCSPHIGHO2_12_FULL_41_20]
MSFNFQHIDASWQACIQQALKNIDPHYLRTLEHNTPWLPGIDKVFNAFSIPVNQVNYILLGESPYPRPHSANGYAFWDAAVGNIWSPTGLSKEVNRATSLRNIIKMLLIAEELLNPNHTSQTNIAAIDKSRLIKTNQALFSRLLQHGFLLLNASLVLQQTPVKQDAHAWQPFLHYVLEFLVKKRPHVQLLLLGQIASTIDKLLPHLSIRKIYAEHPYNISFITNPTVLQFFKPMHLLLG